MNGLKLSFGVLQRISEFLADLPEDQITDLAEGRARLAYVPEGQDQPAPRHGPARSRSSVSHPEFIPSQATVDLLHQLQALGTREAAAAVIAKVRGEALRDAAKALSIPNASKLNVGPLRLEIVEATVGRRIDSIAIRGFEGLRP